MLQTYSSVITQLKYLFKYTISQGIFELRLKSDTLHLINDNYLRQLRAEPPRKQPRATFRKKSVFFIKQAQKYATSEFIVRFILLNDFSF